MLTPKSKIALFGATGGTGLHLIQQARDKGLSLTVFARNRDKLSKWPDLDVRQFSLRAKGPVIEALQGYDVVISLIGISGLWKARTPEQIYERTGHFLTDLASKAGIKHTLVVSSGGVVDMPNEPFILKRVLKPLFLKNMYADMKIMESYIQSQPLTYTIVRPPFLTGNKLTGKYRTIEGWFTDDKTLSRPDLAHFLLDAALEEKYFNKVIGVSY